MSNARFPFASAMEKSATISECGRYRYLLLRHWDAYCYALPVCMLNPSTADDQNDDPTIRELIHFAKLWGYGGLHIVNLCAFRASHPADMQAASDPVGPENNRYLREALDYARFHDTPMLAAWGDGGAFNARETWMCSKAAHHSVDLACLGITKGDHPKHPMSRGKNRIPRDQQPIMWRKVRDASMGWVD
ncbi:hypothetical protein FBZ99_101860 [Rhizobium sp. ERR 1071]|nr:hypothetical protein FBZ99_101860 [Rhizobium sp. ERR1071]